MAQADGSIIVDTELDTQGFAAGSKELQRAIKSLNSKVNALGPTMKKAVSGSTSALSTFEGKAETLEKTISVLEEKLKSLGSQRLPTEDYAWLQTELEKAEKALEKLEDRQAKMQATGVKENSRAWQSLQYDIDLAKEKIATYKGEMTALESSGQAFQMGSDTAEYSQLSAALETAKQNLAEMTEAVIESNGALKGIVTVGGVLKSIFRGIGVAVGTVAVKATQAAIALAKMAGSGIKKLAGYVKNAATAMIGLFKSTQKSSTGFSGGLKSILKYRLGVRSLYALINKLRGALVEGFQNLAQYSDSTNTAISSMSSALATLKNSFAAAFAPILSVVAPILTTLINLLATAISYVGAFFAALTGAGTFTKALAVQKDYAKSLEKTGGAAGKAADEAKEAKRQLAGFDELNVLTDNTKDSGGGGGGGGIDPSSMFTTESIPSAVAAFVAAIKDAFANGEYEEVGRIIARGLNTAMGYVDEWINGTFRPLGVKWAAIVARILNGLVEEFDWDLLGKTVADGFNAVFDILNTFLTTFDFDALGTGIGNGLNGLVNNIEWDLIGQTFANKWNAIINTVHGAVNSFNWSSAGSALSTGINNFVSTVDWAKAGKTLSDGVKGILDFIIAGLEGINWQQIGNNAASFLGSIDWSGITSRIVQGIGAALGGLAALLWGLIQDAWSSVVGWWYDTAYDDGGFTMSGLLQGIWDKICGIGSWIKTNIFDPFINGFKNAFGIHSPSTVMAEMGGYLVEGLLNGIKGLWSSITSFFSSALSGIKNAFSSAWNSIKSTTTTVWNGIKSGLSSVWSGIKNTASTVSGNVKTAVSNAWNSVKSTTTSVWNGVKSGLSSAWSSIKSTASTMSGNVKTAVSTAWNNVKTNTSTAWNGVKSALSSAWSGITSSNTSSSNSLKNTLSSAWNSVKSTTSTAWNGIKSTMSTVWSGITSNNSSSVNSLKNTLSTTWNSVKSTTSTVWSGIKSAISTTWSGISSNNSSSVNSIKSAVSSGFTSIANTMTSKMSSAKSSIQSQGWSGVGSNICSGIQSGINSGWSWLSNTVSSLARSLLNSAKSALGIHSPSRLFRDEIGLNIGYGVGEGVEDSEGAILQSVSNVADAIADEFKSNSYTTGDIVPSDEVDRTMSSFSDTITEGFTSLLDRLQAIAESVTFAAPAAATSGVAPYSATAAASSNSSVSDTIEASNEELGSVFIQALNNVCATLVSAIEQNGGTTVNLDANSLTTAVIKEINRRTRMSGASPLIGY